MIILLIDDDAAMRSMLTDFLTRRRIAVVADSNGADALARLDRERVDAVVHDRHGDPAAVDAEAAGDTLPLPLPPAVWTGLGWWSGGPLAPLVSHLTWTALMISFPVIRLIEVRA